LKAAPNWSGCLCSDSETGVIENRLNTLLINLQCEKKYGSAFWTRSTRRIQASAVHFLLYFKMMAEMCLPPDCETLVEANSKERLVLSLQKLQVTQTLGRSSSVMSPNLSEACTASWSRSRSSQRKPPSRRNFSKTSPNSSRIYRNASVRN
jgi:hypothetical protein